MSVFCSFENLSMEMYYVKTFHMLQEIVFYQAHYFWEELNLSLVLSAWIYWLNCVFYLLYNITCAYCALADKHKLGSECKLRQQSAIFNTLKDLGFH